MESPIIWSGKKPAWNWKTREGEKGIPSVKSTKGPFPNYLNSNIIIFCDQLDHMNRQRSCGEMQRREELWLCRGIKSVCKRSNSRCFIITLGSSALFIFTIVFYFSQPLIIKPLMRAPQQWQNYLHNHKKKISTMNSQPMMSPLSSLKVKRIFFLSSNHMAVLSSSTPRGSEVAPPRFHTNLTFLSG